MKNLGKKKTFSEKPLARCKNVCFSARGGKVKRFPEKDLAQDSRVWPVLHFNEFPASNAQLTGSLSTTDAISLPQQQQQKQLLSPDSVRLTHVRFKVPEHRSLVRLSQNQIKHHRCNNNNLPFNFWPPQKLRLKWSRLVVGWMPQRQIVVPRIIFVSALGARGRNRKPRANKLRQLVKVILGPASLSLLFTLCVLLPLHPALRLCLNKATRDVLL